MKKIIAFDLDGTLTQHKSIINKDNLEVLKKISKLYKILIIGAGSCERIGKQLYDVELEILGQYGLEYASLSNDKLTFMRRTNVTIDKDYYRSVISRLRKDFSFENYSGESVEFHSSGVVTFPILGTEACLEDKLKFDPDRLKRRKIYTDVVDAFPENNVFIGGTSSFDLSPKDFNKYIALRKYIDAQGFSVKDVIYFGDDYGLGGNDESIYRSDIEFVKVDSYLDIPGLVFSNII